MRKWRFWPKFSGFERGAWLITGVSVALYIAGVLDYVGVMMTGVALLWGGWKAAD